MSGPAPRVSAPSLANHPLDATMHLTLSRWMAVTGLICATGALAQDAAVLRDLDAAGRVTLSKDELMQLMPGARISRVAQRGNAHIWTNEADGKFIVSSDNRALGTRNTTAPGRWQVSDDGRYCVLIEWKSAETEEWCRYIIKSGSTYYATRSDKTATERVFKLEISK